MEAGTSADLGALLSPEPLSVAFEDFSTPAAWSLRVLFRLFDVGPSTPRAGVPSFITFDRLTGMTDAALAAIRTMTSKHPVFVCPAAGAPVSLDGSVTAALHFLSGVHLRAVAPSPVSRYGFAETEEMWPFAGITCDEAHTRTLPAFEIPDHRALSLVTADHGSVFLRLEQGAGIYISVIPLPTLPHDGLLKNELEPRKFMGILPPFLFLRSTLADRGWRRTSRLGATFMVDDPNLRLAHYGFLDFRRLVDVAREHDFHTSIAMIPLDYEKTRSAAADVMLHHPEHLSLVMHGVDHVHGEFARDVPLDFAEATLARGLAQMEAHEREVGLPHARGLTFPHGLCNETWMAAMRNVGLDAAIASRSFPFREAAPVADPLYELHPAEMAFQGFPVINRFPAEQPKEHLLFQALLGKPLIVYTHHTFFRDGYGDVAEIADFLNAHVRPRWESIDSILGANYQVRRLRHGTAIRVFSNRVTVSLEQTPICAVLKMGRDIPPDEVCSIDHTVVETFPTPTGVVALPPERSWGNRTIAFGPRQPAGEGGLLARAPIRARVRRLATEFRDQVVMRRLGLPA